MDLSLSTNTVGTHKVVGSGWWFPDATAVFERLAERSPTTHELRQYARELVERYPDLCELRTPETDPGLLGYTRRAAFTPPNFENAIRT